MLLPGAGAGFAVAALLQAGRAGRGQGREPRLRAQSGGGGQVRSRARTSDSRAVPGGAAGFRWRAWRTSRPGTAISRHRKVGGSWPCRRGRRASHDVLPPSVRAVSWCSQAAMAAASSAPHIQARFTWDIRGRCARRRRACCRGTGSPPVVRCRTVLRGAGPGRGGHVQVVRMNEWRRRRVAAPARNGRARWSGCSGPAAPCRGSAETWAGSSATRGSAAGGRRPPVRAVLSHRHLALSISIRRARRRRRAGSSLHRGRDPPGADREGDVRVVGGAGQLAGE